MYSFLLFSYNTLLRWPYKLLPQFILTAYLDKAFNIVP